ncbi:MAG TPA: hypothetical protein VF791_19200 [Pyrinomonadaceae bacterium]
MPSDTLERLLTQLEESKRPSGAKERAKAERALTRLEREKFEDADSLVRFHETLLFMRAYPQGASLLRRVEKILRTFVKRVEALGEEDADLSALEYAEVSGIAGTSVEDSFSYSIARWLARKHPSQIYVNWEAVPDEYRLAATWPRFLPLLEEDSLVEANVPYLAWLRAAKGKTRHDLAWLIERFESLSLSEKEKAELYESLKLLIRWELGNSRATRTLMKRPARKIFYHTKPLLQRRDVSIAAEFAGPPIPLKRLTRAAGEAILDLARETSTVRYRELYGFTHGDAARVLSADLGRGVELFVTGVPPERRLPLRAYHAGLMFKNGVPVCYVEGLSFFERMEIGFNVYYTFREGESAWIYARVMKIFRQLLGVTVFSIDPYQIGYESEEGIKSGAFWFYRKFGFRPVLDRLAKIMMREEQKLLGRRFYRTPERVLRQLAEGHMLLEIPPAPGSRWDRFQMRKIGLAVQRRMAKEFEGDAVTMGQRAVESVSRSLGVRTKGWKDVELRAFENLALVLTLIPDLARWTKDEKRDVMRIIRAKAGANESRYVRLLQRHSRLRDEVIKIGSV